MKIVVFGAGSIGVYLGGLLLAAGSDVLMIGRARMGERISRNGLLLTDLHGRSVRLAGDRVPYTEDPGELSKADLILVTVKSADTAAAAWSAGPCSAAWCRSTSCRWATTVSIAAPRAS